MANTVASICLQALLGFVTLGGFVLAVVGLALGYDDSTLNHERVYENWWPLALEAAVVLGILLAFFTDTLNCHLNAAVAFLTLCTAVISTIAQSVLKDAKYLADDSTNAYLVAAGFIVLAVVDCIGIIFLSFRVTEKEVRSTANWGKQKIAIVVVVGALLLAGWGIRLGGTIPKQVHCLETEDDMCNYDLRFTWWVMALELVVMVWLLVSVIVGMLDKMAVAIAAFLTIATGNLLDQADQALTDMVEVKGVVSELMAGGTLISCIMNMVLLFILCWAGVVCANKHVEDVNLEAGESTWVISTGVSVAPLLLGLGMALAGVSRLHLEYCSGVKCMNLFRAAYWSAAFELFVIVCICCLAYFKRRSLPKVRVFVEAFLVLASLEAMGQVGTLLNIDVKDMEVAGEFKGSNSQGIGAAGFMIVSAMNFVLMLVIGCEHVLSPDYTGYQEIPV